ncbi:DNA recombination protein RmuC [Micavibrio aeruginosavorus]|uniref:RmuC family protein n=1 Tax=Micavibrio aeruginosavorus (strain ARL-13) TaxID=856793 RepID=G2KML6_MICAA|nr:DNA recombination protein RmuC [Micavibrio aeruginosavorus]AEP10709.1 rmuC family protein [Micavibrio aeruginosavorus ARL-13]
MISNIDMMAFLIGAGAGVLAGAAIVALVMMKRLSTVEKEAATLQAQIDATQGASVNMENTFRVLAAEALKDSQTQFLTLAQEKLKQAQNDTAHDLEKRQLAISTLVDPIKKQLEMLGGAVEQIKGTDNALRNDLQSLSRETARLVGALRDPAAQGRWGEYILDGLLEKSGLIRGVHFESQVAVSTNDGGRQRPDAVIRLHDGLQIIVDAKAPINDIADQLAGNDVDDDAVIQNLAKRVRDHIVALGRKGYWENVDGTNADFTVLFLPSEHLFSMALRADPGMVDFAAGRNVIIASPTLMMSLIRVVSLSWRQADLAQNAAEIATLGGDLFSRITKFGEHLEKVGKGLSGALGSYNDAVGSLERMVLPAARKLKDKQVQTGGRDLPELKEIEDQPRRLTVTVNS